MKFKIKQAYALIIIGMFSCDTTEVTEQPFIETKQSTEDLSERKMNNPYYWWAINFPGDVADTVTRLIDYKVMIEGNYKKWTNLKINTTPTPFISTGLYAPVGEIITIDVPEGVTEIKYRIGCFHCSLSDKHKPYKRYKQIVKTGNLQSGRNEIYNYFGGHIYITFTNPVSTPIELKITGAVKSPDFILGVTDKHDWLEEIKVTGVPWGELRCKNMILTMPIKELQKVVDPEELMSFYQEMVYEDYNLYAGMDNENGVHQMPTSPWRYVVDKQLCAGYGHSGYPFVGHLDWAVGALSFSKISAGDWGTFHELGHNYQTNTWKWGALGEVSNNLHVYHMTNRRYNKMHTRSLNETKCIESYVLKKDPAMDEYVFESMLSENIFWGLIPFLQLAQQYGWRFFAYLAREGRENGYLSNDQAKRDFFAMKATEYANQDLTPFFKAWRIGLTENVLIYMKKYPHVDVAFWEEFDMSKVGHFNEREPVKK